MRKWRLAPEKALYALGKKIPTDAKREEIFQGKGQEEQKRVRSGTAGLGRKEAY